MNREPIAILGAGNAGRAMAAYLTMRGYQTRLFNRWEKEIEDIRDGNLNVSGWTSQVVKIASVSTDIESTLDGCKVIILVVPAFAHRFMAELIAPFVKSGQIVVVHPGIVGGALSVGHILKKIVPDADITVAETITSIFASRLRDGGVHIRQVLKDVSVGVLPSNRTEEVLTHLNLLFENRLTPASSVLETSLNNRNPIFHCPTMLGNISRSEAEEDRPFADTVTPGILRLIQEVDNERYTLTQKLGIPAVTFYDSLKRRLGHDAGSLGEQIRAVFLPGGASPLPKSLGHRYVQEDVPFGLVPWIKLGEWAGVPMDAMRSVATALTIASGMDTANGGLSLDDIGISQNDSISDWVARL